MMEDLDTFIEETKSIIDSNEAEIQGDEYWLEAGSRILDLIDSMIASEKVNFFTPKDYGKDEPTILELLFDTLTYIPNPNQPFTLNREDNMISYYELAYSRCCSYICQLIPDRFPYIQKLLIKYLFCQDYICSLLASDVYAFMIRMVHPNQRSSMCQIINNLCKLAPPDALTKGAAFMKRVNFEYRAQF